jgi:inner membrane protein
MMGRTHAVIGLNCLWLFDLLPGSLPPEDVALAAGCAVLGALLPDLDASRPLLSRSQVFGITPLAPVAFGIHRALGHRGVLHSSLGLTLCAALAASLSPWVGVWPAAALWLGYVTHLLADACTPLGIPLLPHRPRFHVLPAPIRITTGSLAEEVLGVTFAVAAFALMLTHLLRFAGSSLPFH